MGVCSPGLHEVTSVSPNPVRSGSFAGERLEGMCTLTWLMFNQLSRAKYSPQPIPIARAVVTQSIVKLLFEDDVDGGSDETGATTRAAVGDVVGGGIGNRVGVGVMEPGRVGDTAGIGSKVAGAV